MYRLVYMLLATTKSYIDASTAQLSDYVCFSQSANFR